MSDNAKQPWNCAPPTASGRAPESVRLKAGVCDAAADDSATCPAGNPGSGGENRTLYVVGGQQHSLRPLHSGTQPWYRYRKGLVLRVRPSSQTVDTVFEYVSPPDVCPRENPAILFKSASLVRDRIYLCTQTEVLVCRIPDFACLHYISLPHFQDVHHVHPTPRGTLLVANTGLDMVVEVTLEGEVVNEWNVCNVDPWSRFSRSTDYRTVSSTKPHLSHPNHIFYVGSDVWVTRFEQRDALCLTDSGKRIHIGLERMHDGIVQGGWIYFTTVDGKIAIVSQTTLRVEETIDLIQLSAVGSFLGWCRGLFVEDGKMWVGFSRLRATKIRENVSWVSKGFKRELPTRISCYDLARRTCVTSIDMEPFGMNAVFSVLPSYE